MIQHFFSSFIIFAVFSNLGKMTTFYSIPTKLLLGIPLVTNIVSDSNNDYKKYSLDFLFFKADIFFSDKVLSNSKAGLLAYKINDKKSSVIWNGVNMTRFQQNFDTKIVRSELNITTDFVIIMVAGFSKLKDYDLFLDVARMLGKARNDITLLGVGDGPELKRIKKKAKEEHIDNVIFPGKQKEVERIISASDIGLLCTYSEGISNSIIECMALGKPVICTDIIGGSREIIVEGETGYCVERNAQKIVDLLQLLLNNSDLRISMGSKGKQRINTNFSVSRMGKEFEIIYEEVLRK
jgi:glycosyltransferase involved in cell wall biosynthesis